MKTLPVLFPLALAVLATSSGAQSLLRAPHLELPPGDYYQDLADLNLDGTIDGLVRSPGGWRVVFNVGTNPIDGPAVSAQPDKEWSALGDVTGDGIPDFLLSYNFVPQGQTSGVQFLRGNGDGTFAAPVLLPGPGLMWRLILADVNGDGVDDVVTIDWKGFGSPGSPYEVNAWFLNGPTPQAAQPLGVPFAIEEMAAFDLNGDGAKEVAVARFSFEPDVTDVLVVRWDSSGISSLVQSLDFTADSGSLTGIQAGDIDGDGDEDLLASLLAIPSGQAVVLENVGGVLSPGPLQTGLANGPYLLSRPLADWDGDGDDDAVRLDVSGGFKPSATVHFVESTSTGFELAATVSFPFVTGALGVAGIVDLDNDGYLDVVTGSSVYFGRGVFDSTAASYVESGCCIGGGLAEDLDRDGDLDLWGGQVEAWYNDATGKGPVLAQFDIALPGAEVLKQVLARGDFDGDGSIDYLVEWGDLTIFPPGFEQFTFRGTRLVRGLADGSFVDGGIALLGLAVSSGSLLFTNTGDMDGDGALDVLSYAGWYPNRGGGTFGAFVAAYSEKPREVFDLDADGDLDLLFRDGLFSVSSWRIEVNDGTGSFSTGQVFSVTGKVAEEPLLFDFDGDGLIDICSAVRSSAGLNGVAFARNLGAGSFAALQVGLPSLAGYDRVTSGDINGDGVADLIAWLSPTTGNMVQIDVWLGSMAAPGTYTLESFWGGVPDLVVDMDGDGDDDIVGSGMIEALSHDGPSAGSTKQYGFGFAGGVTVPLLGAHGPFVPGSPTAELRISHGVGGASYFVFWGLTETFIPDVPVLGAGIFIAPITLIYSGVLGGTPGAFGEGDVVINKTAWTLAIPGLTVSQQALLIDPAYPNGLALTNAVTIGYGF